ncbi:MAG TPA: hypothetical protein PKH40_04545, partial [Treponemataceae bacterium]|nr:hypothetical protein [Treponemataceae bacterium]
MLKRKHALISAVILAGALLATLSCASGPADQKAAAANTAAKGALSAAPGTFENAAPAGLPEVIKLSEKLQPKEDELVIFYVRKDKDYAPWALWL